MIAVGSALSDPVRLSLIHRLASKRVDIPTQEPDYRLAAETPADVLPIGKGGCRVKRAGGPRIVVNDQVSVRNQCDYESERGGLVYDIIHVLPKGFVWPCRIAFYKRSLPVEVGGIDPEEAYDLSFNDGEAEIGAIF